MTQILITGGTGFIGSRLALRCRDAGEDVRILGKLNTHAEDQNAEELERSGIEFVNGSVTDPEAVGGACDGVEVVYHLAAAQHEANVPDSYYYDVNVEGTRTVLDKAIEHNVSRFVHGSTIGVFGIGSAGPVTDDSPLEPDNIYGITKLEGEKVVRSYCDRMPIAIARIAETYGPGDRRLVKLFKGIVRKRFFMIGSGENLHALVYIDDLIDGLRLAAARDDAAGKTFVLAGPEAISSSDMVRGIAAALNVDPPKLQVPLWPLMVAAVVMETGLRPLGVQPPLHRRRMNFFVKSFAFTCSEARSVLGYEPRVGIAEGAAATAAWYRQMQLI
jgi:nucleoside-diphosphate-sugar epimerase